MENVTVVQIFGWLGILAAFIGSVKAIRSSTKSLLESILKDKFDTFDKGQKDILAKIDKVESKVNRVDLENCKNYLVTYLAEIDRGIEKDEVEKLRFWEEYEHYKEIGGNSYIHNKVEDLKRRNLL